MDVVVLEESLPKIRLTFWPYCSPEVTIQTSNQI